MPDTTVAADLTRAVADVYEACAAVGIDGATISVEVNPTAVTIRGHYPAAPPSAEKAKALLRHLAGDSAPIDTIPAPRHPDGLAGGYAMHFAGRWRCLSLADDPLTLPTWPLPAAAATTIGDAVLDGHTLHGAEDTDPGAMIPADQ